MNDFTENIYAFIKIISIGIGKSLKFIAIPTKSIIIMPYETRRKRQGFVSNDGCSQT